MNHSEGSEPDVEVGFFAELRRRKVVRVALAYLVSAWLLIQVTSELQALLPVPDWTGGLVFVLLAVGFPIAVILAWAYELTPEGIKLTQTAREQHGEAQHARQLQRTRNRFAYSVGILGAVFALATGIAIGRLWPESETAYPGAGANQPSETGNPQLSGPDSEDVVPVIAVLPFRNMSASTEDAYFTEGVGEEILTRLSRLPDVDVISRTSVMRFAENPPSIPEIAELLGATHVLEGSVRRAGNTVRITAQLIDASDKHLWAANYDRDLELIFAIQTDVAVRVAEALRSTIAPELASRLTEIDTENPQAYAAFHKARQLGGYGIAGLDMVRSGARTELLREAVRLDPDFVRAWQQLAKAEAWYARHGADEDGSHLSAAQFALEQSRRLSPHSADTLATEAIVLHFGLRDFEPALQKILAARAIEPRRANFIELQSRVLYRLGRTRESIALLEQASRLDPLNVAHATTLGDRCFDHERYADALRAYTRAESATPEPDIWVSYRVAAARIFQSPNYAAWNALQDRHFEAVQSAGDRLPRSLWSIFFVEHFFLTGKGAKIADTFIEENLADQVWNIHYGYFQAAALEFQGQSTAAKNLAKAVLAEERAFIERNPTFSFGASWRALHQAWLGGLLEDEAVTTEGVDASRRLILEAKNARSRRIRHLWYVEGLLSSDPEAAQAFFLEEMDPYAITLDDFLLRPHLFYRLLDHPEVRARFDDKPEWVQFMRDRWPESRRFPFD